MTKEVSISSGINSLGIPYTIDNINHIGYFDIICKYLTENGFYVNEINLSNIAENRTFDLENIFNKNKSYNQIRKEQFNSLKNVIENNKYIGNLISEKILDKYIVPDILDDKNITDLYVDSSNPIFLYSGGANDFMYYIKTGPMELVNKEVRDKLPKNILDILKKTIDNVEKNWQFLICLNPTVQIYSYNFFYAPIYDEIQQEIFKQEKVINPNLKYKNIIKKYIDIFNTKLLEKSKKYDNVNIIDIKFIKDYTAENDFHQNYEGNKLIAKETIKYIDEYIKAYNEEIKRK